MRWLVVLLVVLIGAVAVVAQRPDVDASVVLAMGYAVTIVGGVIVGRLWWGRARRERR